MGLCIIDTYHNITLLSVCTLALALHNILSKTLFFGNLLGNILGKWYTFLNIASVADLLKKNKC